MSYGQANICAKLIDLALYYHNPSPVSSGRGYLEVGPDRTAGHRAGDGVVASEHAVVTASASLRRRKERRGYALVPSGLKTEDS